MRDLIVFIAIVGSLPLIIYRPWIGILVWSWIAYMAPHRLAWGFAYDLPFAAVVAACCFVGLLFSHTGREPLPKSGVLALWIMWILWMSLTTVFAEVPADAWVAWERAMKIQLFAVLTVWLIQGRQKIDWLVLVIVLSIGFYGFKGGLFAIRTGGSSRVLGPPDSFIEDNNALALALIMIVPLIRYLQVTTVHKWLRRGLYVLLPLTLISVLASQSRGALLASVTMLLFLIRKTKRKFWITAAVVIGMPLLIYNMPDSWTARMHTIQTYEEDGSAMGRINAWTFAWHLALDQPVFGGGFGTFIPELFARYQADPTIVQGPHSIYFQTLGEHGFVGLFLFIGIGIATFRAAGKTIKLIDANAATHADLLWARELSAMLQVSLIGYTIGGAFLGLAYFDLPYHIIALVLVCRSFVERTLQPSKRPAYALQQPPPAPSSPGLIQRSRSPEG